MTSWYWIIADFFGGAFIANALPHLIAGVVGKPLETPFASPPFKGLSPPAVNVAWALFNLAVAFTLLRVAKLDVGSWSQTAICFAGFAAMSLQCARAFGRLRRGRTERPASRDR